MCISVHLTKYKFINLMSESSAYELWELMFLWTDIVAKISDKKLCCRKEAARCFVSVSKLCWTVFAWNGTGTLRCLQKEMAIYRHWSVSLWRDPDDVPHCRILFPDKTEWRLISATLCGWRRCFVADQLWFMTRTREVVNFNSRPTKRRTVFYC